MQIFSKHLLHNIERDFEILGTMPSDISKYYELMKRGDDFFFIEENQPKNDISTEVSTKNHIYKTSDFKNWIGSGIGSAYTRYDNQADAFFSVTLGYPNADDLASYHVTKINPDDFSYSTHTMMPPTSLIVTSRGITNIERVGNTLMCVYYKEKTNVYTLSSTNNGQTWSEQKIRTISSYGAGLSGFHTVGNGQKFVGRFDIVKDQAKDYVMFSSPTAVSFTDFNCLYGTNPCNTVSPIAYDFDYTNKQMRYSKDMATLNYLDVGDLYARYDGVPIFYGDYMITNSYFSMQTQELFLGKIIIYNLITKKRYIFDHGLNNIIFKYSSYRGYCKVFGIFDEFLYFSFSEDGEVYKIARVKLEKVFKEMTLYE